MAPGPGAAAGSPLQSPGATPLSPYPVTDEPERATEAARANRGSAPPAPPRAPQQPRRFGTQGVLAFSDLLSASLGSYGYTQTSNGGTHFGLTPAVDYFIATDTILGGSAFVRYAKAENAFDVESRSIAGGGYVHFGRNVPWGQWLSVRPLVAVGLWYQSTKLEAPAPAYSGLGAQSLHVKEIVLTVDLFVPLLLHPVPHFFVGFGPDFAFDPYRSVVGDGSPGDNLRYSLGASSIIGGWL